MIRQYLPQTNKSDIVIKSKKVLHLNKAWIEVQVTSEGEVTAGNNSSSAETLVEDSSSGDVARGSMLGVRSPPDG